MFSECFIWDPRSCVYVKVSILKYQVEVMIIMELPFDNKDENKSVLPSFWFFFIIKPVLYKF